MVNPKSREHHKASHHPSQRSHEGANGGLAEGEAAGLMGGIGHTRLGPSALGQPNSMVDKIWLLDRGVVPAPKLGCGAFPTPTRLLSVAFRVRILMTSAEEDPVQVKCPFSNSVFMIADASR